MAKLQTCDNCSYHHWDQAQSQYKEQNTDKLTLLAFLLNLKSFSLNPCTSLEIFEFTVYSISNALIAIELQYGPLKKIFIQRHYFKSYSSVKILAIFLK